MAIQKMSKAELTRYRPSRGGGAYVADLKEMKVGEGGKATTKQEKCTKQTIKNRLNKSADALGMKIKYIRSGADEVVFQVVSR